MIGVKIICLLTGFSAAIMSGFWKDKDKELHYLFTGIAITFLLLGIFK